ncbi:MAG: flagellar basal body P-ring formation chaperone FlgA [Desulfobacterales bacterium]
MKTMNKGLCIVIFTILFSFNLSKPADAADRQKTIRPGHPSEVTIPESRFQEQFNDFLYQRLGKDKSDIILSRFKVANNRPVPEGMVGFQLFQKHKGLLRRYVRLIAMVDVDGVVVNEVKLSAWVDVFAPVVCAARNLKKGAILRKDDVYLERKNVSRQPANTVTDADKTVGLLVKNSIKQGTSLKEWMLEKAPILNKGDLVTILAQIGSIRITVPGKILEKGYPNELIRVQNAMSNKELYARVMNNSTVTIDF